MFYQPASSLVNYVNFFFFSLTEHLLASYWKHTDLETLLQRKYLRGCMVESWLACWDWLLAKRLLFRKRDRSILILKWSHQILNKRFSKTGLGLGLQKKKKPFYMQNSGKAISKCLPSLKIDHIILLEQCVQLEAYIIIRYFLSFLIFNARVG